MIDFLAGLIVGGVSICVHLICRGWRPPEGR